MLLDHVSQVGNVLISLGEEVRQTLVLLVVNHLTISLLIFSLRGGGEKNVILFTCTYYDIIFHDNLSHKKFV